MTEPSTTNSGRDPRDEGSKHIEPPNDPRVPGVDDESPETSRETGGAAPAVGPGE